MSHAATSRTLPLRRQSEWVFLIRFVVLAAGAAALWAALTPLWPALEGVTASIVAPLTRAVGTGASATDASLTVWSEVRRPFTFTITDGCTGLSLILIYAVAVLAYPATRRQWWAGIGYGSLALFAVNTIRLTSLAWIGAHRPSSFEAAHEIWWQGAGCIAVCLTWFVWLRLSVFRAAVLPIPHSKHAAVTARVARSVLRSHLSVTALLFAAIFSCLALLGVVGGVLVYGRVVSPLRWFVSNMLLDFRRPLTLFSDQAIVGVSSLSYALLIGGAALLGAMPGVERHLRIRGILVVYLPLTIASDAILLGILDAVGAAMGGPHPNGASLGGAVLSMMNSLILALHLVLPLLLWRRWSRRAAELAERRPSRTPKRGRKR